MRKRDNTIQLSHDHEKVLTKVGAFFVISMGLIIIEIAGMPDYGISGTDCSGIVACFKMKTEHKNLHRNKSATGRLVQLVFQNTGYANNVASELNSLHVLLPCFL